MLIVSGNITVDPDAREHYLASCIDVVRQARAAGGCLDFAISADVLDPTRINVYERWDTEDNLLAFRGSGPEGAQSDQIRGADMARYTISETGPA